MKKHFIQIDGGIHTDDIFRFFQPALKRCFPVQSPVGCSVVFGFYPSVKPHIEILETFYGFRIQWSQELFSHGTKESFQFTSALRLVRTGMDKQDSQNIQYATGLLGDKGSCIIGIMPNSALYRLSRKKTNDEVHVLFLYS